MTKFNKDISEKSQEEGEFGVADICVVEGSRRDRCITATDPGLVEHIWINTRPPALSETLPTVSARKVEVMTVELSDSYMKIGSCPDPCETLEESLLRNPLPSPKTFEEIQQNKNECPPPKKRC